MINRQAERHRQRQVERHRQTGRETETDRDRLCVDLAEAEVLAKA